MKRGALLAAAAFMLIGASSVDNPEPGRQGEVLPGEARILPKPYSKNIRVIGHEPILGRTGNVQLAWSGSCAYASVSVPGLIGGLKKDDPKAGLAVIDVSNPAAPKLVKLLREAGAIQAVETIHAVDAPKRKVLVAGAYAGGNAIFGPKDAPALAIYDTNDCKNPKLMAEVVWPENVHTVTLSADGKRVYGSTNVAFAPRGGVHVLDISDMAKPRYVTRLGIDGPDGKPFQFAPHEISVSPDQLRIYAAVPDAEQSDIHSPLKEGFSVARMAPEAGGVLILDNSDIVEGKPNPKLRLISSVPKGGWHSVMMARIKGVPHLVGGGELAACPGAYPQIINIADENWPFIASSFRLEMNYVENCSKASQQFGAPGATLHYNDVDSATNTQLGLFNFTSAGLRIADLSNPAKPTEIAYFRPGDMCTGHVRYLPKSGHIWALCNDSGFWVLKIEKGKVK